MTIQSFLTLLLAFSGFSSLITQTIKSCLKGKNYSSNVLAVCVGVAVGIAGILLYTTLKGEIIQPITIEWGIVMGIACGLTSMVGYDKVKQAILQIKG